VFCIFLTRVNLLVIGLVVLCHCLVVSTSAVVDCLERPSPKCVELDVKLYSLAHFSVAIDDESHNATLYSI